MTTHRSTRWKLEPWAVAMAILVSLVIGALAATSSTWGRLAVHAAPVTSIVAVPAAPALSWVSFQGQVTYAPDDGQRRPQPNAPVQLLGYPPNNGQPVVLASTAISDANGAFTLMAQNTAVNQGDGLAALYDHFVIEKGVVRGTAAGSAGSSSGSVVDPARVSYPGATSGATCCTDYVVVDAVTRPVPFRGRYLIITSDAVKPVLTDFIAYKRFLGFTVLVKTVEELDPSALGGNFRRNQIRNYEASLYAGSGGLEYVLLAGSDKTIPFVYVSPWGPDPGHMSAAEWAKSGCKALTRGPNNCGWPADWFYADLSSDWNSNGDAYIAEGFWAEAPADHKDDTPTFHADVFLGRLPLDAPSAVAKALETSVAFERNGGLWKDQTLLAGAMLSYGGKGWEPADAITGTYKALGGLTDTAYLFESLWKDILYPAGMSRVRLYEKEHAPGLPPPDSFAVDAPLTLGNFEGEWSSDSFGLVAVAGHGNAAGVYRTIWNTEIITDGIVEDPTAPLPPDSKSAYELSAEAFIHRDRLDRLDTTLGEAPILFAFACSTGLSSDLSNLPSMLLARGRITAWAGGASVLSFRTGWKTPANGGGETMAYTMINELIGKRLPLGDAVWTGLEDFNPGGAAHDWGFLVWDLYGDPSLSYWGNGPDLQAPWPMFQRDWPGTGQTFVEGPAGGLAINWSYPLAAPAPSGRAASPVVGRDGRVVVGDADGDIYAVSNAGALLWSYHTGGPIRNAAALSQDGTVYVKSGDGKLYAINGDGTLRWSRLAGDGAGSPKVSGDGTIYVSGSDNNGLGGTKRYLLAAYLPDGTRAAYRVVDSRITTTPSFGRTEVWVGTEQGTLYGMSYNMSSVTSAAISPGSAIGDGLAVAADPSGTVLVPSADHHLIAWSAASEMVRWSFITGDAVLGAPALGNDSTVFVGSCDGKIYAMRLADGSQLWQGDLGGPVISAPALDALHVYAVGGTPAQLYALNRADGTESGSPLTIGGASTLGSSPALAGSELLYVVSGSFGLLQVGNFAWRVPPVVLPPLPLPHLIRVDIVPGDPGDPMLLERRIPGGNWSAIAALQPGTRQFGDQQVVPGQRYEYRALALPSAQAVALQNGPQPSGYSAPASAQALQEAPNVPPAPAVSALSTTRLHLTWQYNDPRTAYIRVIRESANQPDVVAIAEVPASAGQFTDDDLLPSSQYLYRLQAGGEGGESGQGQTAGGVTRSRSLPAPALVAAEPLGNTSFRVCWQPSAANAGVVVARQADGEADAQPVAELPSGQTCFTDNGAYPAAFEYWVKHTTGNDESPWARSLRVSSPALSAASNLYLPLITR